LIITPVIGLIWTSVWLVWSPGTVSHWTFVPHLHYELSKTCPKHLFSRSCTSLNNCFAQYGQRTLYGAIVVTSHVYAL